MVASSLATAGDLAAAENITVLLLGGRVRGGTLATVDHWARRMLRDFVIDLAYVSANGISRHWGLTTPDPSALSADELARPGGRDVVVDATGNAAAIQDGLDRVAKAGTFLQFGVADYATTATIAPYRIYNQEITIAGSMAVLHSYERAAELFASGVLDPQVFISHRLPLAEYPQALDRFPAGQGRKIVVLP
ncbi:zinc-binding dehydrogenase [Streptomyces sp. NPDC002172]